MQCNMAGVSGPHSLFRYLSVRGEANDGPGQGPARPTGRPQRLRSEAKEVERGRRRGCAFAKRLRGLRDLFDGLVADEVIEGGEAGFRPFAHRDDDLFVRDRGRIARSKDAGQVRRAFFVDHDFAEL